MPIAHRSLIILMRSAAVFLLAVSTPLLACNPERPEKFSTFFNRFLEDKKFAVSRTIYPVNQVSLEYYIEDGKQHIAETRRKIEKVQDTKYPALGIYLESMGIASRVQEASAAKAVVEVFKPGANGFATYHFLPVRGCWFLYEMQNHFL